MDFHNLVPLVSVLIPVYQAQPYLRECIDSVLSQPFRNYELILCDDGSSDESGTICEAYARKDSRVTVLHRRNSGNFDARKTLLQAARGDYILFIDADDYIDPDTLQQAVSAALAQNSDIVMFGHRTVADNGELITEVCHHFPEGTMRDDELTVVYRQLCTGSALNYLWDKLIRRSAFASSRSTPSVPKSDFKGGDICQMLEVMRSVTSFSYIDRPLYSYRQSSTGMGRRFRLHFFADARMLYGCRLGFLSDMLQNDPEIKKDMQRAYLTALTSRIMSAVHCRCYSFSQLHAAFEEERNAAAFADALQGGSVKGETALHSLTLRLFRHKWDRTVVLLLRVEQDLLSVVRRRPRKHTGQ